MTTFLHKKFRINLKQKLNIPTGSTLLLAISGGQDSLCLLKLSLDLQKQYDLRLGIVYIDHQWRYDTYINSKHLINFIKQYKIPTYLYQIQPTIYSECESRNLRYQLLIQVAKKYNYNIIATAHSCTDQVENCLQYMIRGTSLDGINSLVWSRKINKTIRLIRPILNFKRSEISWFCKHFQLPVWSDFTNLYYDSPRNRIRQELMPYLQNHFQGNIEDHINQFLNSTCIDCEYLRQNTIKAYQKSKHNHLLALNQSILSSQHIAIQTRVLQLFFLHNFHKSIPPQLLVKISSLHTKNNNKINSIFIKGLTINYYQEWIYVK
uniref:tRNA(Ile)-lysidine synthase, chloroplastic n=1 Tax=Batrachospermum sp. TaxID=31373 RepID=A0A8K1YUV4_9FLOR|nr:tRNA(Ile)-lysidine synthase [Batrachospermum sp.]